MEEDTPKDQQPGSSSEESKNITTESNTTEEIKTDSDKTKFKLPKIKLSLSGIKNIYEKEYKKLLIIPFALLLIAVLLIGFKFATTGDFINRDVSLKGGVTVTIPISQDVDILQLKETISLKFPANDISTRSISRFGAQSGIIVEADIENDGKQVSALIEEISKALDVELEAVDYSVEIVGSSLGASFFKEVIRSLIIAFLAMGMVVFLYFGPNLKLKIVVCLLSLVSSILIFTSKGLFSDILALLFGIILIYIFIKWSVPSLAVILAALSDILITLAIVNLLGIKLSTAGIAAFLMLIGYSVDTDILLSTRVLKRKEGTDMERIYGAFKTGITMSLTTLTAITMALMFAQSGVIKQIMIILLIGLLVDLINTWIQNVGILRLYLERKARKSVASQHFEPL